MRNLKLFGLMLGVAFAFSAVAASAASADLFHIETDGSKLTVASNGNQTFTYEEEGAAVVCTTVGGSGELAGEITNDEVENKETHEMELLARTGTAVTFSPTYSGCTIPSISGSSVVVDMNECDYKFTLNAGQTNGPVHVECPGSNSISITVSLSGSKICTFHIGSQTPAGNADYANSGENVSVTPTQTGIVGSKTNDNGFGFLCGAANSTTGTYTGSVVVKGETAEGVARKVWVE